MSRLTFGSLFAGIGGFDLGFERAGMECAWQVERDKHARVVLEQHWPEVDRRITDVRKLKLERGSVDLICGGFPCQDVSVAGNRAGLDGKRSGLWFEFHRLIGEAQPRWVVIENVPGLLSSNGGRDMGTVLGGMAELGYGWAYRVLDAQYFGVAQRRRRVFIVGHLGDWSRVGEVLFEPEGSPWDPAPRREAGEGITATPEGIAGAVSSKWHKGAGGPAGDEKYNLIDTHEVAPSLGYSSTTAHNRLDMEAYAFHDRRTEHYGRTEQSPTLTAGRVEAPAVLWEPRSQDGTPRIHEGRDDPTLNTATGGQRKPMVGVRRLTPRECERLQGFPDDWTAVGSDTQRYKQLGNAVCVNVAEWLGRRIVEVDRE